MIVCAAAASPQLPGWSTLGRVMVIEPPGRRPAAGGENSERQSKIVSPRHTSDARCASSLSSRGRPTRCSGGSATSTRTVVCRRSAIDARCRGRCTGDRRSSAVPEAAAKPTAAAPATSPCDHRRLRRQPDVEIAPGLGSPTVTVGRPSSYAPSVIAHCSCRKNVVAGDEIAAVARV